MGLLPLLLLLLLLLALTYNRVGKAIQATILVCLLLLPLLL
jgi:hypothetical protein